LASDPEYPTGEHAVLGTWRYLGCGDRLYIESHAALPPDVLDRLEAVAGTMRDLTRAHAVAFMDIGPYASKRLKQPPSVERRRAESEYRRRHGVNG
jgi:hypothetical protein